MKNKVKIRCKNCGSSQTYIKLSVMKRVCRNCGYIEQLKGGAKE